MDQKRITLSAITLRGIGSYAREARLDIRRITLLAGANGTGKSTWIKVINELVKAQVESRLPFGLPCDLWNSYLHHYYEERQPNEPSWMNDKSLDNEYGFIGTIGLHGRILENFKLPPSENEERPPTTEGNDITSFFWHGSCSKGNEIRILLSLLRADERDYGQQVSVYVDKQPIFAFVREKSQKSHTLLVNSQLLPESNSAQGLIPITGISVNVEFDGEFALEGVRSTDTPTRDLYNMALKRCTQLLTEMLQGFFYISPIREPVDQGQFDKSCDDFYTGNISQNPSVQNRYVGEQGEDFPEVYYNYSLNSMDVVNADTPIEDADNRSCFLESYCGSWMRYLVEVFREDAETRRLHKPTGFSEPCPSPDEHELKDRSRRRQGDDRMYRQYEHDCFPFGGGLKAEVTQLSSGFHQIAPLLLQGALLQRNETMLVENPEVHLHPSAQSKIMEYFVREAAVGKYFIIETHSDILVLRLLRAILSEDLPQESIRIYFTELVGDKDQPSDSFKWSQLKRIEIDDQGRIFDWPKGFMDQRMKEFDFIMNARFMQNTDDTEAT